MNVATLVGAFASREPLNWCFHVLTLAIGGAIVLSLLQLERALSERMARDLAGVDLVIGAKGSPSQLVLSALLQVDAPTGNIPAAQAERFAEHPLVKTAIPVSMGDSVRGMRIVGTTQAYADLYDAVLVTGRWWNRPMEAVLGAEAAQRLGLAVGDAFAGQHGLSGGEAHEQHYEVTGILAPSGTTIDRLVLTDLQSVWDVHAEHDEVPPVSGSTGHAAEEHAAVESSHREVTALLIRYSATMGAITLPRLVSATPDLQPAVPALEVARLVTLLGVGTSVLRSIGWVLLTLAGLGFVVALFMAFRQRRRELSLLRVMGASPGLLAALVALEGAALGALGGLLGVALSRGVLLLAGHLGRDAPNASSLPMPAFGAAEALAVLAALALALCASLPAAWLAGRLNPARELARAG